MARPYSRNAFLKAAPNSLLHRYLAAHRLGGSIQWKHLPEKMTDDINKCIEKAAERKRSEIDNDFQEISGLADEGGMKALIAEGATRHHGGGKGIDLAPVAAEAASALHFAFQVFLDHRDIFEVARDLRRADSVSETRWRRRSDLAGCVANTMLEAQEQLGRRISEYYMLREGRGQHCHVDHWERGERLYWFAYPEDYGHASLGYDDEDMLKPQVQRRAFDIIYVFCPAEGWLDLSVKGDQQTRQDLQRIFGEAVLGEKLPDQETEPVTYELDALMDRNYPLRLEAEDGVEVVRIKKLRLRVMGIQNRRVALEASSLVDAKAVYDMLDELLKTDIAAEMLRLTGVGMQLVFRANERGRKRTLSFDVGYPNSCSLNYLDSRCETAKKLLRRWGIDVSASAKGNSRTRRRSRQLSSGL